MVSCEADSTPRTNCLHQDEEHKLHEGVCCFELVAK